MPDPRDVSVSKLLAKMVCAMVDLPEFVVIKSHAAEGGASFAIEVHPEDTGKIIGKQGRNAKSLRIITSAVGQKLHRRYVLPIDEGNLG
ncbi:MAG: KH domain-containing protein [Acidobacteriota bacterium]|nr:KH domain-containing protein [Acidobacteriota bacterium]